MTMLNTIFQSDANNYCINLVNNFTVNTFIYLNLFNIL